jgi:hypothetical protein
VHAILKGGISIAAWMTGNPELIPR